MVAQEILNLFDQVRALAPQPKGKESEMDIKKLRDSKPWFVPKWLWNQIVNTACDAAKENLKVNKVAEFAGDAAMDGLAKAINGKDPATVEMVCTTVANGGQVFVKAAEAAKDGTITPEEKVDVGNALMSTITTLVPQERIDEKIEEIRSALLFG